MGASLPHFKHPQTHLGHIKFVLLAIYMPEIDFHSHFSANFGFFLHFSTFKQSLFLFKIYTNLFIISLYTTKSLYLEARSFK